ncbi:ankyrin repeat-containing domain protein [Xylariales sp. PMI_506]|nr:ankyrin repeat-containing domain protein [Xylariales sp. PMI_506]
MARLSELPYELLVQVGRYLALGDVSSLTQSCRRAHIILNPHLYNAVKNDPDLLCWAAEEGYIGTARHLLRAGADPNMAQIQRLVKVESPVRTSMLDEVSRGITPSTSTGDRLINTLFGSPDWDVMHTPGAAYDNVISPVRTRNRYWAPLHLAVLAGNEEMVELLLSHGADVDALSRGFCECDYPRLPPWGGRAESVGVQGSWKPLHVAIAHHQEAIARLLLARGASVKLSPRGSGANLAWTTALHQACGSGSLELVKHIIEEGYQTDVNVRDDLGQTPLAYAFYSNWDIFNWLLSQGADINKATGRETTLLYEACNMGRYRDAIRLLKLGASANFVHPTFKESILHCACGIGTEAVERGMIQGCVENDEGREMDVTAPAPDQLRAVLVQRLVAEGVDVNSKTFRGFTPLMVAAQNGHAATVETLLDLGADTMAKNYVGDSALIVACKPLCTGDVKLAEVVKMLLDAETDPNIRGKAGQTALHILCSDSSNREAVVRRQKVAAIRLLHECGANLDLEDASGDTPLVVSLYEGLGQCFNVLLSLGASQPQPWQLEKIIEVVLEADNAAAISCILKLRSGRDTLCTERRVFETLHRGLYEVPYSLLLEGAPWRYALDNGTTSLMLACRDGNYRAAAHLLAAGADPKQRDSWGNSAFDLIYDPDIVEIMLDHGVDVHRAADGQREGCPVHRVIQNERLGIFELMVDRGCLRDADDGSMALYHAEIDELPEDTRELFLFALRSDIKSPSPITECENEDEDEDKNGDEEEEEEEEDEDSSSL